MANQTRKTIGAVQTTCEILEVLRDHGSMGVTDLAAEIGMTKSGVYNHLTTLREEQFITKNNEKYRLSFQHISFSESAKNNIDNIDTIEEELENIAKETGELSKFGIVEHGQLVYVSSYEGEKAVTTSASIGNFEYLHCTALGKAMLAKMPRERVKKIINQHGLPQKTPQTITNKKTLSDELKAVRNQDYAVDDVECVEGLRCIATAITKTSGGVIGGLSVTGPASRMSDERIENELTERIADAVNVIELESKFS